MAAVWVPLALLAACASLAPAYARSITPSQAARVDAIVRYVMRDRAIPGAAVGIATRDGTIFMRGYGAHVTARTVFAVGSLTKLFTSALVERLVARGLLHRTDTVGMFEPQFLAWRAITIAQLLEQTSGIPDYAQLASFNRSRRVPIAPDALLASVASLPLDQTPGSALDYSNTNDVLLAVIAQRVTHVPYQALLQRTLLRPLQLNRTHVAYPYLLPAGAAVSAVPPGSPTLAFGAADLASNVPDLLAFITLRLHDPQFLRGNARAGYEDGLMLGTLWGRRVAYASGYVAGFSAYAFVEPRARLAVVVLADADAVDLGPLAQSVAAIALGIPDA